MPSAEHAEGRDHSTWKKLLLIDAVQDPGNVGTMIRTADAAGMDAVILGKGTADAYNPKTVRSAQGSHFNIPIVKGDLIEWVDEVERSGYPSFRYRFEKCCESFRYLSHKTEFALIVGNEGSGVNPELLEKTDQYSQNSNVRKS